MARTCPQCGTPNSDQANACTRCGFRFTASAPAYNTPPQGYQPQQPQSWQQPPQNYQQPQQWQQPPQGYPQQPQNWQQPPQQWQQYPPQGQYQPQPGTYPPAPAAAPKGKRGPGTWIVIALIALVLLGGGGFAIYTFVLHGGVGQDPASVLNAYCGDLKNNDFTSAYQLLSKNAQKQTTQQEFQLGGQLTSGAIGGFKSCAVSNVHTSGSQATGQVTLTGGNGKSLTETDSLVLENGAWKLDKSASS
jgi:hypothetical protein